LEGKDKSEDRVKNETENPRGFSTNQVSASSDEGSREIWNSRLEELKSYKQAHGHCNVLQIHEGGLGTCIILKCRLDVDYPGHEPNFK